MKSLLQRLVVLLCVSQIFVLPVLADELINISDIKGCRAISGDTERLACYDTVIDGGVFNEQKLKQPNAWLVMTRLLMVVFLMNRN